MFPTRLVQEPPSGPTILPRSPSLGYQHNLRQQCEPLHQWYSTGGTRRHLRGYVDYTICITCIMYQQLWGYKVEEKLYLGVREQKRLNTTALHYATQKNPGEHSCPERDRTKCRWFKDLKPCARQSTHITERIKLINIQSVPSNLKSTYQHATAMYCVVTT
jgi:hypothetical protein